MDIPASPNSKGMFQFCQTLSADNFSHLSAFAQQYFCQSGFTCRCKQDFSAIKMAENKQQFRLTGDNLAALPTFAVTGLNTDINRLALEHMYIPI
jgi:hypothetical protein